MSSRLVDAVLDRAFGRPRGLLGRLGGWLMARSNAKLAREVIRRLEVAPTDLVLEIGFGPGAAIERLAERAARGAVVGIDPSQVMLAQASRRNAGAIRAGRVELLHGTAGRLPFDDASFDRALVVNSLHVWPDSLGGLREVRRVLRPGGRLGVGFTRHARQEAGEVATLLAEAGFRDIEVGVVETGGFALAEPA